MFSQGSCYRDHAAPSALRENLLDGQLSNEEVSFKIGGDEATKIIDAIVREGLGGEDASVVDDVVDRSKLADRTLREFLCGRRLTDIAIDERQIWRRCEPGLRYVARIRNDVISAIKE